MSGISDIIEALVPIFGIVVLGYFFGFFNFLKNSFWDSADKLTYYILLPALLITRLSAAELQQPGILAMSCILVISIVVLSVLLVLLQNFIQKAPEAFCSVFQGSIRPNIYVVLATAAALFGEEGITLVAIALATVTPLVNFLSIWVINYYSSGGNRSKVSIALSVIKNPIIIGCVTGILLNISNIGMPFGTAKFGEILGSAALPVGLLSVGAGLNIRIDDSWKMIILPCSLKLVVLPIFVALTCLGFAIEGITKEIAILLSSVPCAASSYIFATQLGGDEKLMARIISLETLIALLTMPLCLWIFF